MYPHTTDSDNNRAARRACGGSNDRTATMKRVNIQLKDDDHTRAKIIAVLKGVTLNDYLARIVAEAVERDKKVLDRLPK